MQKSNTETLPLTICVCICMRLQFQFVCKCLRIVLHKLYYWKCSLKVCVTCKDLCYFYLLSLVCALLHVWKMSSYPQFPKLWITNLKKKTTKNHIRNNMRMLHTNSIQVYKMNQQYFSEFLYVQQTNSSNIKHFEVFQIILRKIYIFLKCCCCVRKMESICRVCMLQVWIISRQRHDVNMFQYLTRFCIRLEVDK